MTAIIIYFSSCTWGVGGGMRTLYWYHRTTTYTHTHTREKFIHTLSWGDITEKVDEDGKDDGACSQEQPQIACQTPVGKLLAGILLLWSTTRKGRGVTPTFDFLWIFDVLRLFCKSKTNEIWSLRNSYNSSSKFNKPIKKQPSSKHNLACRSV